MNKKFLINLILGLIFIPIANAQELGTSSEIQTKVRSEIENMLSKSIPQNRFSVQVQASSELLRERIMVEGESFIQNTPPKADVPALPGFEPELASKTTQPTQNRQVFKNIERHIFKSISVNLNLDSSLDSETQQQLEGMVNKYLNSFYPNKFSLSVSKTVMQDNTSLPNSKTEWFRWIALLLAGIFAIFLIKKYFTTKKFTKYSPSHDDNSLTTSELEASYTRLNSMGRGSPSNPNSNSTYPQLGSNEQKQLALPNQNNGLHPLTNYSDDKKLVPLPNTPAFADSRSALLNLFLNNTESFRLYYEKLEDTSKTDLCLALRGPAFQSLTESIGIKLPEGLESSVAPSEDQMLYYQKNFQEFLTACEWQEKQFFGFLYKLTAEQIRRLLLEENPFIGALILKQLKSPKSAEILETLPNGLKEEIVSQFFRINEVSTSEINLIEKHIREKIPNIPHLNLKSSEDELQFFTGILNHTNNQDELLIALEKSKPELYQKLAKFRFSLNDVSALPSPLVTKVLDEIDNELLSKAIVNLPDDTIEYLLSEVSAKRRDLLKDQLSAYKNIDSEDLKRAKQSVTLKFREEML